MDRRRRSLQKFACPPVAVRPVRALWAHLSVRIIDPLFVRAANDPVGHHDGLGAMRLQEAKDFFSYARVCPNVAFFGEPTLHDPRLGLRSIHDPNRDLAGSLVIGTVESDRRDRIASKAAPRFLLQW
jgi:hypothetical protein